jgi:catechol 2,3-dioxygenase-like lactoylglutathione lyase family enzyme
MPIADTQEEQERRCPAGLKIFAGDELAVTSRNVHDVGMTPQTGLAGHDLIGFVTIFNVEQAKHFYGDVLGLQLIGEELPFALVFSAHGNMLRLAIGNEPPKTTGTVLGWKVTNIAATATQLRDAGVKFERYGFMEQDALGVWSAPGGAKVAWFRDPDGNTLSISQHV